MASDGGLDGAKVLVTGATGFLGGRLVEKLVLQHRATVRALVRDPRHAVRLARFPLEMVRGDIADPEAVGRAVAACDIVFHCAHDFGSNRSHWTSAVRGTRTVAEACLAHRTPRLVQTSTFAVYGFARSGDLTESMPWQKPNHPYGKAKQAAERYVKGLHRDAGLPVVSVQPTIVYGPRSKAWTIDPVRALQTGLVPLIDGGRGLCNAVYVDDVADGMILAGVQEGIEGHSFLLSAEEPITWAEFHRAYERSLGVSATVEVPRERLPALARRQRKRIRRELRNEVVGLLGRWAQEPQSLDRLKQVDLVHKAVVAAKGRMSPQQWDSLKSKLSSGASSVGQGTPPVHLPDPATQTLYESTARVRIDKARQLLGYEPAFDFERGMKLTSEYLRWARLVNDHDQDVHGDNTSSVGEPVR